ncbi:MAG: SDR family NAD(P)-dependent oxidoreductase [Pseudomonadota bacterium]
MADTFVFTGATSGFGAAALKQIGSATDHALIVGARDVDRVEQEFGSRVRAIPLDLSSLESVCDFCAALGDTEIHLLAMNAGMQTRTLAKTADGFETTFQTNYLSHFLMFDLLKDQLAPNALIVTTGSGTHDPEEKTPVPAPKHANIDWLAYPEKDPDPDRLTPVRLGRAYSTSKLLCILQAKEIAARYPRLRSASFDPGYLPDTNLAREYPKLLASIIKRIIPYTMKNDRTGSVATTAPEYARVLQGDLRPNDNGGYVVMRSGRAISAPPSELARQKGLSEKVWEDSIDLLLAANGQPSIIADA